MKVAVYNLSGKKTGEIEMPSSVFGLEPNDELLHQAYVAGFANKRNVLAHTKDRGERAGTGKKPWRQKGTGNARAGSVRSPLWRKGGITFGPTNERNFKKDITKKMKQKAICVALSEKIRSNKMVVVEEIKLEENKTKRFNEALKKLNIKGTLLVAFDENEAQFNRSSRNIEAVDGVRTSSLSVFDILNHQSLLMSKDSVDYLANKYSSK